MGLIFDRVKEIRLELATIAEKEAHKLWRLARKAEAHGVSDKLVNAIREEGWSVWDSRNNPDRLIEWRFEYQHKYAFRF